MDVIVMNKFLLGVSELNNTAQKNADANADGALDSTDSLNILKFALEMIPSLPVSA